MKSWMSTRRPACAPPPKIWISRQRHAAPRRRRRGSRQSGSAARGRGRVRDRHRDGERRVAAEPRLVRRAVERDQARVDRRLVGGVAARRAARAISPSTLATARCTSRPPNAAPPSRRSTASRDARRGAGRRDRRARPRRRRARPRPRPSAGRACPRRGGARTLRDARVAHAPQLRRPGARAIAASASRPAAASSGARDAPHALACRASPVEVLDRRLAVDAREEQARQQRGGARLERRARLPVDARRDSAGERVERSEEARRVAAGVHRHLSSRWLRQKARSKAGSPYQAHSASRNTGPSAPIRMFFGLTSPCTSARFVAARRRDQLLERRREVGMARARSPAGRARGGWRRRSRRCRKRAASAGRRRRGGMDAAERRADRARGRRLGVAAAQQLLPEAMPVGREPGHDEDAGRWCWPSSARRRARARLAARPRSQRAS